MELGLSREAKSMILCESLTQWAYANRVSLKEIVWDEENAYLIGILFIFHFLLKKGTKNNMDDCII